MENELALQLLQTDNAAGLQGRCGSAAQETASLEFLSALDSAQLSWLSTAGCYHSTVFVVVVVVAVILRNHSKY